MIAELYNSLSVLISSPWVWLILFASVLYAAGNYLDEMLLSKYDQDVGTLVLISTFFGAVVAGVFLIIAYLGNISVILEAPLLAQALMIGVLEAFWVIPYLYATERSGAIIAGPLFQAVPVFALVLESFLGVIPPQIQIIGALIIVAGGILISIESEEDELGTTSRSINWGTIGMMSVSAILVSLIYVLFRDAAIATNFVAIGFWTGTGTFLTGISIYFIWKPYRDQFDSFCKDANYKAVSVQLFNEVLDASGLYMTNLATTLGPSVMIVTAFNATQPIAVGIIGALLSFFGISSISTNQTKKSTWILITLGILLIAIGIVTISLGGYA